jgi:O-antigen/teichoic acid export membrane protein
MSVNADDSVLSGAKLARSTRWNLIGTVLPLLVVIPAVPLLVGHLGTVKFGLLSLAFALIGYMSIFDFGLSRGVTQMVASGLDSRDEALRVATWTAQWLMGALGVGAAVVLFLCTPWLVESVLHLHGSLAGEAILAFRVLSLGLPTEVSSSGLRGVVEAQQRFDLSNMVRIPMAVLLYAAPVAVLPFTTNLAAVFASLAVVRFGAWGGYCVACARTSPWMGRPRFAPRSVVPVLRLAGWMSVSNFISPLLVYADRFLVAALLSVSAVAYYATPYDAITKLLIVSAALSSVLFPAFAFAFTRDRRRALRLFTLGGKYLFLAILPISFLVVLFAHELLSVWLGPQFATQSTRPLQLLAFGVFANGLASIPFALIQGAGRPDLTAKLHMAELPPYLVAQWVMTVHFGIAGTALVWSLRVLADMVMLYIVAWRMLRLKRSSWLPQCAVFGFATMTLFVAASLPIGFAVKCAVFAASALAFALVVGARVLTASERSTLTGLLRRPRLN